MPLFVARVAGVERGREKGKRGEKGSLPFPLFRAFLPPPLPPLFAPATQATLFGAIRTVAEMNN